MKTRTHMEWSRTPDQGKPSFQVAAARQIQRGPEGKDGAATSEETTREGPVRSRGPDPRTPVQVPTNWRGANGRAQQEQAPY